MATINRCPSCGQDAGTKEEDGVITCLGCGYSEDGKVERELTRMWDKP